MQHPSQAYAKTAQATASPRELEATILLKAALRLQGVRDDFAARQGDLDGALTYNRKLWTVLVSAVTQTENPLPAALKQNVANLGVFVFNHTIRVMAEPAAEKLNVLITINRELAAGLRATPPAQPPLPEAA